jgi:hypothetical protein
LSTCRHLQTWSVRRPVLEQERLCLPKKAVARGGVPHCRNCHSSGNSEESVCSVQGRHSSPGNRSHTATLSL